MNDAEAPEPPFSAVVVEQLAGSHRDFLKFLERRVGSRAEAEDILQEAFVRSAERAGSLRENDSAVAWFYRALRNAVIDRHRRRAASARTLAAFAQELETTTEPPADVESAVCACVGKLAGTLKPEYADALRRVEVEGMSVQGYAAELGIQAGNAAVRVHRARAALRTRVMASCGTCAEHGCLNCTCTTG